MIQRRLSDVIYDALLEALVEGRLEPGQALHDRELAEQLEVSRTPVREALQRLQEVGLVDIAPGRYTRVTPLDPKHIGNVAMVLAEVSSFAAEVGTAKLSDTDVTGLQREAAAFVKAVKAKDSREARRSTTAFSDIFFAAAGNEVLTDVGSQLAPQMARWLAAHPDWTGMTQLAKLREESTAAARRGDGATVSKNFRKFWRTIADDLLKADATDFEAVG
jgi:DNA-binding GntR family transcriptional regulator